MQKSKLGEQESALLAWVASKAPASAAQVVAGWGAPGGLARTTVTTMLERLRAKGYLVREKDGASFVYSPQSEHETQLRGVVGRFVERTLGGSLDPFVAFLSDADLSEAQKTQLRALVERLDSQAPSGADLRGSDELGRHIIALNEGEPQDDAARSEPHDDGDSTSDNSLDSGESQSQPQSNGGAR